MSDDVGFKHGRALEDEYFRKKDQELIEKLRRAGAAERSRRDVGAWIGSNDPAILQEIEALGFIPDTVILIPFVPVVQMAWADGSVAPAESALIVELARSRGITEGSAADRMLSDWLANPPAPQLMASASRLIRVLLAAQPSDQPGLTADELVGYCESIAEASGGIFGIRRISSSERAMLTTIAAGLKGRP